MEQVETLMIITSLAYLPPLQLIVIEVAVIVAEQQQQQQQREAKLLMALSASLETRQQKQ